MGRYYNGDIEGKFWFGVQSSDDAEFFGGSKYESVEYQFEEDDIPDVKKGIGKCEIELGENLKKLKEFFEEHNGYNDEMLKKETGIENTQEALIWYARLRLGKKILVSLKNKGHCYFDAEF